MVGSVDIAQMTLAQIQELLHRGDGIDPKMLNRLREDPRRGALKLWCAYRKAQKRRHDAQRRLLELLLLEKGLRRKGARAIAGLDEAGRGPLAGPVVAAAVILPWPCDWVGLDDSKRLTPGEREKYAKHIMACAPAVGRGVISAVRVDAVGILPATWEAMRRALASLSLKPDHLLVDGPFSIPGIAISQSPLVNGDARSLSVAAASVVAKVTRDEIMRHLDKDYPQYGFVRHKGYGTPEHLAALRSHGPSPVHRRTFRGVDDGKT